MTSFLTNVVRIIHVRGNVKISWEQLLWSVGNSGLDRGILVVHVCTRQTTAMDVSVVRFSAGVRDPSLRSDGAPVS